MDPWKLKVDEESKLPVFQDPEKEGDLPRPIFISPEGKDVALDAPGMYEKIIEMGKTEKELRGTAKRLEGNLELFADIEDIKAWKESAEKAIQTVANFNDKDWMDVKKVDKLKEEMITAHTQKVKQIQESFDLKDAEYKDTISKKDIQIRKLMVSAKFATHPLFSGKNRKTTLPPEIAETYFGKHFKVEENDAKELVLMAYHADGSPVYSHDRPGELAEFTEAMHSIFERYPGKDELIRPGDGGSGAGGGQGDGSDGGDGDEIAALEKQYADARATNNVKAMVALNNRIFAARKKKKAAA